MHLLRRPALFAAFALALPALHAQGTADGALRGRLADSLGRVLPRATLLLRNQDTTTLTQGTTAQDGTFLVPHLPPGPYILTVVPRNADPIALPPITIPLGEALNLQAILRPRGTASSVLLSEPAEADPTAPDSIAPDLDADTLTSAHGLPTLQNASLLDGLSATQAFNAVPAGSGADPAPDPEADSDSADLTTGPAHGLARGRHAGVAYLFSQSSIREFRIFPQNSAADAGNSAGAVLTRVSRGGSAKFHGQATFVLRSETFAATNALSLATRYNAGAITTLATKPHDLRETYTASLSGPIPRVPQLFAFYTFDAQRRGFPAISSPTNPAFYSLTNIQTALLATRGVTQTQTRNALTYLDSLTGPTDRRQDQTIHFVRLDYDHFAHHQLGLQLNRVRWSSPAGLIDAPVVARGRASLGNTQGSVDSLLARWTWQPRPSLLNQLRLQYLRDLQYESPQTPLPQEAAIGPGGLAPEVVIGPNGLLFGTPATLSQQAYPDERRFQLADTATYTHGHQTFELGIDFSAIDDRTATLSNAAGAFRFDSTRTSANAGGLVDFITDATYKAQAVPNSACPSLHATPHLFCFTSFTQSFGQQRISFPTQQYAAFFQHTSRPAPWLTLHAGVRYEYLLLPIPQSPNPALDALFGTRGATSIFPEDRNNLGPRLGVDLEPFGAGRGTLRVGYGAFFGRLPGATIRSALADTALPTSTTSLRITPTSAELPCPQSPANPFGYVCSFLSRPPTVLSSTYSAVVFDRHFRLPVVQQGTLTLERTLTHAITLSATYLLDLDRQLPASTDLNIQPSTVTATYQTQADAASGIRSQRFVLPLYTARVSPSFGPVTDIVSNGNGTYNALSVAASAHTGTVLLRVSYTWSKALDFGPDQSAIPRTLSQLDPFTNGYDKGLSALNYPQLLHLSASWSPRSPHAILNHWTLAPLVLAHSGRPYSYQLYGGTRLPGGHLSLNGAGGALYLPTVGRNTLRLPYALTSDLRLARTFSLPRETHLRLSAEAFNLTNRVNLSSVEERAFLVGTPTAGVTPLVFQDASALASEGLTTQPFGTPTASSTNLSRERQIQLSLHLEF